MYDVIYNIIGHPNVSEDLVLSICGVLICVITAVFIDLFYRLFRHFWR